jgi:hypothetical protein
MDGAAIVLGGVAVWDWNQETIWLKNELIMAFFS